MDNCIDPNNNQQPTISLKQRLIDMNENNSSVSDIVLAINEESEINREAMSVIALSLDFEELSERIDQANTIIKRSRVKTYLRAVANGSAKLYLAATSLDDKISLAAALDMNSTNPEIISSFNPTIIGQASRALEIAAQDDILTEANRFGLADMINHHNR